MSDEPAVLLRDTGADRLRLGAAMQNLTWEWDETPQPDGSTMAMPNPMAMAEQLADALAGVPVESPPGDRFYLRLPIAKAGFGLEADSFLNIEHGTDIGGPRVLVLNVDGKVWVPVQLAIGKWLLSQPDAQNKRRIVLPGQPGFPQ